MPIRNCDCKIILLSDLLVSHRSRLESWSEAIVWICACVMKRNLESLIVVASLACRFNTPKNALGTRSIFNVDIHEHFSPFRELKAVCVSGWTSFSCSKKLGFFFSSPFVFWRMSFHFWLSCVAFSHRKIKPQSTILSSTSTCFRNSTAKPNEQLMAKALKFVLMHMHERLLIFLWLWLLWRPSMISLWLLHKC